MVDTRTYAPFHQHFLIARLDMDVDGPANTVHMVETSAAGYSEDDPYGLGLVSRSVPLTTESEGRQDYCWETQRGWKIVNPSSLQPRRRAGGLQARAGGGAAAHAPGRLTGAADR